MYKTVFGLEEIEGYEEELLILNVIKGYVDATVAGKPQFRISTIVREIQRQGYDITGQRISRFINSVNL